MTKIKKKLTTISGALFLVAVNCVNANAAYPSKGDFDGYYKYESEGFTLLDESYSEYLTPEIVFEITTSPSGSVSVVGFLTTSTAEYDQQTGVLTLNSVFFKPTGVADYLGIAPLPGGWTGMSGLSANKMKWQITEKGDIEIPDFDVVTFSGSTVLSTIAEYRNGSVSSTDAPIGGVEQEVKNFAGTYSLKGTKFSYTYGTSLPPETTSMDFDLVINDNNQITSIGGYTLTTQDVRNGRNKGRAVGNELILDAATSNGVKWQQVATPDDGTYTEAWLLGGPDIMDWNQLDPNNRIIFTLNDDGSYSLSPFTLWHRHQIVNEYENTETVFDLLFKWEEVSQGPTTGVVLNKDEAETRYYNLHGLEIKNPEEGQIVILKQGKEVKKVIF